MRLPSDSKFEEILCKLEKADIKLPTLIYNGEVEIALENRANFEISIVIAKDNLDKDITGDHVIKNSDNKVIDSIDRSVAGKYTITYTAVDKDVVLECGEEYEIQSITAIDNVDGPVEVVTTIKKDSSNEIITAIDTKVPDVYIITYETIDKAQNKAELVIKVTVKIKMIADNIELGKGDGSIESQSEIIILESTTAGNITKLLEGIRNEYSIEFVGESHKKKLIMLYLK